MRPEGGRPLRRPTKEEAKQVSEGRETLRREGVLLVRAIEEFKGKMILSPDKEKIVGKSKRKQLKFKLHDVIRVTSGSGTPPPLS